MKQKNELAERNESQETQGITAPGELAEFGERLVTLCDGKAGLRAGLQMETREPAQEPGREAPCLDFIASDETLDRYHEILLAGGWRLDAYRRNPIVQNAHQYGDIIFTLGKALITEVRTGRLYQRIEFATEINPLARIAYGLYRGKFLNAVSVGFIPIRWENGGQEAGYRRKYLEQELLEVSAVCIPANPNALQLGVKAGAVEKADLRECAELLRLAAETPIGALDASAKPGPGLARPGVPGTAESVPSNPAPSLFRIPIQWLQAASPGADEAGRAGSRGGRPGETVIGSGEDFCSTPAGAGFGGDGLAARLAAARWLQLARVLGEILRRA